MAAPKKALSTSTPTENESLPTLIARLGEDVMQLVDTKLSLLKVELKEEANTFARTAALIAMGGIIAAIGFALLNVAVAFGVSTLFANANLSQPAQFALGFVVTGLFYLVIGAVVVMTMKNRLSKVDVLPNRTVEELRKDKQWLKNEI
jgi:uncharacterized membrane protein YqjE